MLGCQFQEHEEYEAAECAFRQALDLAPEEPDLWFNLAVTLRNLGRTRQARNTMLRAIELDDVEPEYWFGLGNIYRDLRWLKAAERAYWQALKLEPEYCEALNNLGRVYIYVNEPHKAEQLFLRGISLEPGEATFYVNLGTAQELMGRYGDAIHSYKTALDLRPTSIDELRHIVGLIRRENPSESVSLYEDQISQLMSMGYRD